MATIPVYLAGLNFWLRCGIGHQGWLTLMTGVLRFSDKVNLGMFRVMSNASIIDPQTLARGELTQTYAASFGIFVFVTLYMPLWLSH
jgi:hypothetical protein